MESDLGTKRESGPGASVDGSWQTFFTPFIPQATITPPPRALAYLLCTGSSISVYYVLILLMFIVGRYINNVVMHRLVNLSQYSYSKIFTRCTNIHRVTALENFIVYNCVNSCFKGQG